MTRTIVGPQTRVNSYAEVEDSILFAASNIGRRAKIRRAIIDKGVRIPEGFRVGYDDEEDLARGFTVSAQRRRRHRQGRKHRADDGREHLTNKPTCGLALPTF